MSREGALKENKTAAAAMQEAGRPMFTRLCEARCAEPKPAKKKKAKKSKGESKVEL